MKKKYQITNGLDMMDSTLDTETWKDIEGYEGLYQVSDKGRVKSYVQQSKGKIRYGSKQGVGYVGIILTKNSKPKRYRIHRLVANAFIPNPDNLPQVNHKNGIKYDNKVDNLEWCDGKYNSNYTKLLYKDFRLGENHPCNKYSTETIIDVYRLAWLGQESYSQIATRYNMSKPYVREIKYGKKWGEITKRYCQNSNVEKLEPIRVFGKCSGELSGRAKLNKEKVLDIYNSILNGKYSSYELSLKYSISKCTVSSIVNGKSWNSVTHHLENTSGIET